MKCTLDGGKTKVFSKAVQSLAKFGSDLFIEADSDAIQLRALNSTHSAVGTIRLNKSFFDCYEVNVGSECYCKLAVKACLTVFRSTKHVERCDMEFLCNRTKLQIKLKCRLDTIKNTVISVDDEENITANVSPECAANVICGHYRIFSEISNNFNSAEEEITIQVLHSCVTFKNYVEGTRVSEKFMRSQLKITANEFETYKVGKETSITFCLKEFRAFLLFAEALNASLLLRFDETGSPVFVGINQSDEIDCLLIMSTLSPEELSFSDGYRDNEVYEITTNEVTAKKCKFNNFKATNLPKKQAKHQKCIEEDTTLSNDSYVFHFESTSTSRCSISAGTTCNTEHIVCDRNLLLLSSNTTDSGGLGIDPQEDETNCILASPKRAEQPYLRSVFSRCFNSTYVPNEPLSINQIYAPASDTEE